MNDTTASQAIAYAIYRPSDGVIVQHGHCQTLAQCEHMKTAGMEVMQIDAGVDPTAVYVRNGSLYPRIALPAFDTLNVRAGEAATVTGLPNPTQAQVSGAGLADLTITDGSLTLRFSHAGAYRIDLDAGAQYQRSVSTLTVSS